MNAPILTISTDFGTADHYVAVIKGVVLSAAPHTRIVDVTHQIDAHNILAGAFVLANTVPWFPAGTVHLVVVDPGVGSQRRIIAGRWGGHVVVAPDNGLLSMLHEQEPARELYEVTNQAWFLPNVSHTFHGRDIMAPVAARLASGEPLSSVGPRTDQPLIIHSPAPREQDETLIGEVIYVDHFGNLVTNIPALMAQAFGPACVHVRNHAVRSMVNTYAEVRAGTVLALIGSSGWLEIAVNQGSACAVLDAGVGDPVIVRRSGD